MELLKIKKYYAIIDCGQNNLKSFGSYYVVI